MGWERPKCLLPCPGGTLLDNILEALCERGHRDVAIVVGYQKEIVKEAALRHPIRCTFVTNADYALTNTVYSLRLASDHLAGGFMYFNADVWFDRAILDLLLGGRPGAPSENDSLLAVDSGPAGEEEVKVIVDDRQRILRIGKELPCEQSFGEFIGIARFAAGACGSLIEALGRRCERPGEKQLFFESALDDILGDQVFRAVEIGDLPAIEIDTPEDYAHAKSLWHS